MLSNNALKLTSAHVRARGWAQSFARAWEEGRAEAARFARCPFALPLQSCALAA
jgi:hypothetical protein